MRTGDSRLLPVSCLVGAVLFWGTGYAATKTALGSFSPMTVIWLRMIVATVVFAPLWSRVPRPQYRPGDWKLLALTGLLMPCLYYLFEGFALHYTTSSQAGVVSALVPLLVAVGAWLFLRERLGARPIIAIAISLLGVAVLSLSGATQVSAPNPVLGAVLEFLAVASAAGYMLITKHLGQRYHPWLVTGSQVGIGALVFLPSALLENAATWSDATPMAWGAVIYLGVFVSLGAFGLYNTALGLLPASRASMAINAVPAVALLTGWLALGETLSAVQLLACAAILGAVVYGESGSARPRGAGDRREAEDHAEASASSAAAQATQAESV